MNHRDEFYLWVVRMPLMTPSGGVLDLSFSERYGSGSTTYAPGSSDTADAIVSAAMEAIRNESKGDLVLDSPAGADNVRMQEVRAYGLLLTGDDKSALEVLRRVKQHKATHSWEEILTERASMVENLLEKNDLEGATAMLHSWRRENCSTLGLSAV